MKKLSSKTAITLIELIVSSLLVVIVILGIFSIHTVLSNNNQDYGQRYLVKSTTQTTLNHILSNAFLAVGSANAGDEAILIGAAGVGDANSFCIHQNGKNTPGGQNQVDSLTDIWLCYSLSANQINWCAETYAGGVNPRGASSCSAAVTASTLVAGTSVTFLGSAFSMTNTAGTTLTSSPNFTQALFSINILNCLNNASCSPAGPSGNTDPNNPEVQLSGSVLPLQVSSN